MRETVFLFEILICSFPCYLTMYNYKKDRVNVWHLFRHSFLKLSLKTQIFESQCYSGYDIAADLCDIKPLKRYRFSWVVRH